MVHLKWRIERRWQRQTPLEPYTGAVWFDETCNYVYSLRIEL